ncbi:DUF3944 domain-containing protein [Desulfuromonas acetoxidans]|uniref:DUF3944 domain-containing protein n=1 Tax=Desulfuromonas acetoxidans TaxID=891 RepID=UPI00292F3604|nr:DUF3944 domain-containing protein [Desulfuromonas acetoxidans]
MAIQFRDDDDLKFLQFCDNEDLGILADILKGPEGDERLTEQLTHDERFSSCNGNYTSVWDIIAGELQLFGGDWIPNRFRGYGVPYRELLTDVCKQMKVNFNKESDISTIEMNLLMKVLEKSLDKMTEEERREFSKQFGLGIKDFAPNAVMLALQMAIKAGGFKAYQLAAIVANAIAKTLVGRGLPLLANAGMMRGLSLFAGPIGWAVSAIFTLPMITGPAYRVTIPACIQVAYMRQKSINKEHF